MMALTCKTDYSAIVPSLCTYFRRLVGLVGWCIIEETNGIKAKEGLQTSETEGSGSNCLRRSPLFLQKRKPARAYQDESLELTVGLRGM
jgi:hypothetical protein